GIRPEKTRQGRPRSPAPGVRPRQPRRRPRRRPPPGPARRPSGHSPRRLGEHAKSPPRLRESPPPVYRAGL
ncbi:MAG: hypothetical protein AVDCRST_MAG03-2740, partial [uncultured Rubrobacteraceae bacterium]